MEKITITTKDAVAISALLWDSNAFASILLLHMMPAQKESWVPLADKLSVLGFNVLAIDFRGHGESGGGDYRQFSDEQHQAYYKDVLAATAYLKELFPHTELYLGGASIGANLVIKYMSGHHDIAKGFALSPGIDYYGVRAIDDVPDLNEDQKLLLVGSYDDTRKSGLNCGQMANQLFDQAEGAKEKIILETGGHGTDMLLAHSELEDSIVRFISE